MKLKTWFPILALGTLPLVPTAFFAQENVLFSFHGTAGANPIGGMVLDAAGNLYGTTWLGGNQNEGAVFKLSPAASGSWTETRLFSFRIVCGTGGICFSLTGTLPKADLSIDTQGNLYGTTSLGGSSGNGTVFRLTPPTSAGANWIETVLHDFHDGLDGGIPLGGVLVTNGGYLLGTAGAGGPGGVLGCGVVFRLVPESGITRWNEEVLHSFGCLPDGASPQGDLIRDASGQIYGTTFVGGAGNCFEGCGTVYRLTPPVASGVAWTETVLYSFLNTPDGVGPYAGLVRDSAGNLYGTTYRGGTFTSGCQGVGCGVVFRLSPPAAAGESWTETVLYSFTGQADGGIPLAGLAIDTQGNLYGTASTGGGGNCSSGCGVVFKLSPSSDGAWTQTVLHRFTGSPDGASPQSGLVIRDGTLYGTTFSGGDRGLGTVYSVVP